MHHMFTIEDLRYAIFSLLSYHQLTIVARVHSTWSLCANSLLWRNANLRLDQVMKIYSGRVYHVEDRGCKCTRCNPNAEESATIETLDWKRFQLYAPYIKEVEGVYWPSELLRKVSLMARSEKAQYIFPNIRFLKWRINGDEKGEFPDLSTLIAPSLDHLCFGGDFWIPSYTNPHLPFFNHANHVCQLLEQRVPTLRTFQFILPSRSFTTEVAQCVDSVQKLLKFFAPTLRSVQLPGLFNTESIIGSLLTITNICSLNMDGYNDCLYKYDWNAAAPDIKCAGNCPPRRRQFPSLCSFAFAGSSQDIERTFIGSFDFSSITYLKWFKFSEYDVDINFMRLIPSTFPRLCTFYLEDSTLYSKRIVPWSSLQPVLRCEDLTNLRLPGIQVSMNRDELIGLLANRTNWTVLEIVTDTAWLRLQDLYLFARFCPDLVHLGITLGKFDSSWPDDPALLEFWFPVLESVEFFDVTNDNLDGLLAGELLYYICDKAVYVVGGTITIEFCENAEMAIAAYCIAEEINSGTPMSAEVRDYAKRAAKRHGLDMDIINYLNDTDENDVYDRDGHGVRVPDAERDAVLLHSLSFWFLSPI